MGERAPCWPDWGLDGITFFMPTMASGCCRPQQSATASSLTGLYNCCGGWRGQAWGPGRWGVENVVRMSAQLSIDYNMPVEALLGEQLSKNVY